MNPIPFEIMLPRHAAFMQAVFRLGLGIWLTTDGRAIFCKPRQIVKPSGKYRKRIAQIQSTLAGEVRKVIGENK